MRARPDGSRRRRATGSADRGGRRGRSRGRPSPCRGASGEEEDGHAPSATATAWTTSKSSGLGHSHQSGASAATSGSKWAPRREICPPWRSVTSGSGREPSTDGLGQVADVEPAGREGSLLEHCKRRHARGKGGDSYPQQPPRPRHAAIARSSRSRQRSPSADSLARASYVSRPPAPIRPASAGRRRAAAGRQPSASPAGTRSASCRR